MYNLIFKRLIDISISLFLLLILSPLLLSIAIIIKIQDGGIVFFIQKRVGYHKKLFPIYKFRSMPLNTPNVESHQTHLISITPFGKFIRRTNIDELPQLFNILKGDMSLIGPRPSLPGQDELIKLRTESGVYSCKPGLTGLAQINSYNNMPTIVKAKFDAEYAKNINFINDIKIIFKTLIYLTKEPPTY
jgi:O-antigen biosynthesis protein WbqP